MVSLVQIETDARVQNPAYRPTTFLLKLNSSNMKTLKLILIIPLIFLLVFVGIILYDTLRARYLFDVNSFNSKNYSEESIAFFSDITFREGGRIRKWESDIRVELDSVSLQDSNCIVLTDQVISILTPLIKPLKIYRVKENGNLIIHANVDNTPINKGIGYTEVNHFNLFSESICKADVYTTKNSLSVLPHEMCHAIGLAHPENRYPYYNIMGINSFIIKEFFDDPSKINLSKYDLVLDTNDDFITFQKENIIPPQEREVIKMLYSEDIKVGLKKKYFLKKIRK